MKSENPLKNLHSVINVATLHGTARLNRPPNPQPPVAAATEEDPRRTEQGPSVYWLGLAATTPAVPKTFLFVLDAARPEDAMEVGRLGLWGCTLTGLVGECELTFLKRGPKGNLIGAGRAPVIVSAHRGRGAVKVFGPDEFKTLKAQEIIPRIRALGGVCILKVRAMEPEEVTSCCDAGAKGKKSGSKGASKGLLVANSPDCGALNCSYTKCPVPHVFGGETNPFPA